MDLEARKYAFIRELFKVEKPGIMDQLEQVLKKASSVKPDTVEQYNKDLDEAIEEIERGKFYTQEEVRKIASQW